MNIVTEFIVNSSILVTIIILMIIASHQPKQLSVKILFFFFLLVLFVQVHSWAVVNELCWILNFTNIFRNSFVLAMGLVLQFYVKSLTDGHFIIKPKAVVHLIPVLVYFILALLSFNITESCDVNSNVDKLIEKNIFIAVLFNSYLMFYLGSALQVLRRKGTSSDLTDISINKVDFKWIKATLLSLLVILTVDTCIVFYNHYFSELPFNADYSIFSLSSIAIILLGYFGVKRTSILMPKGFFERSEPVVKENEHQSQLTISDAKELILNLEGTMLKEKPYLDENLNLHQLAKMIGLTDKKLSVLLNKYMRTTFYDNINKYRIKKFKEVLLVENKKQFTLMALAEDCGFKSKSSFNRIFKRETGMSPSEYKRFMEGN